MLVNHFIVFCSVEKTRFVLLYYFMNKFIVSNDNCCVCSMHVNRRGRSKYLFKVAVVLAVDLNNVFI
jgi:hypothetical protein